MQRDEFGLHLVRRDRLVLEIADGVDAAYERGAVFAVELAHARRDVADGEADAPVVRRVGRRAVHEKHVVQRSLARLELQRGGL